VTPVWVEFIDVKPALPFPIGWGNLSFRKICPVFHPDSFFVHPAMNKNKIRNKYFIFI
jgi:hypothetical protein